MINILEFFNNPMGKGASALNIKATKNDYDKRYDKFVKKIVHQAYFIKDNIYIHVKIPSSVDTIFYDVVIKFIPTKKSANVSVNDMEFQIFSNSPSFIYTYANSYNRQKILLRELNKKLSKKMINDMATVKNPYGIISYDYTVYCALKYIISNDYTKIDNLKIGSITSNNIAPLLKAIPNWENLQKQRGLQKEYIKMMEKQKEEEKKNKIKHPIPEKEYPGVKDVKEVKNSKKSKSTKTIKTIKKIKRK